VISINRRQARVEQFIDLGGYKTGRYDLEFIFPKEGEKSEK
jgi:hypothetical protein